MLDSIYLRQLLTEMRLEGAHINKINQPERDELLMNVYGPGGAHRLLLSANASAPRIQYTDAPRENPQQAPMFCMFMRKYLTGAFITKAVQPSGDRIAELYLECTDEIGIKTDRRLIIELMGRYSNIILVDSDGRIMESLKHVDFEMSPTRQIMPGLFYRYPELQGKLRLDETDEPTAKKLIDEADGSMPADKFLLDHFMWMSPVICREAVNRVSGGAQTALAMLDREALCREIMRIKRLIEDGGASPCILYENKPAEDGRMIRKPVDFTYLPLTQYGTLRETEPRDSWCGLLDEFYTEREAIMHMQQRSQSIRKSIRTLRSRQAQKLAAQREELSAALDREELRRCGELITASIYMLEKGQRTAELPDYEAEPDENGIFPLKKIVLDPKLSPKDNAQAYFKRYRRAKNAELRLYELIAQGERDLEYLDSVLDELDRASGERELEEIKAELAENGYTSQRWAGRQKGKQRKLKLSEPMEFVSSTGYCILAGRNNRQNEQISLKIAQKNDLWFHVQHSAGSHVIIRCGGTTPDDATIGEAAAIAAYHSAARQSGRTIVDYTRARNVRRQPEGRTGMVFYTDYKSTAVMPDEELVRRLAVKNRK